MQAHIIPSYLTPADTESYIGSSFYSRDLAATRVVWSDTATVGIAGALIFLTYLSLPVLLKVRSSSGMPARSALDGKRERAFLMNITGCTQNDLWNGGIRNRRVWRQAGRLGRRHLGFDEMQPCYLDFIGTVITAAPLAVRAELRVPSWEQRREGYWRYMGHAMSLLSADIGDEITARSRCLSFIDDQAASSEEGSRLYALLRAHHPWYVEQATPVLPERIQAVVGDLRGARC